MIEPVCAYYRKQSIRRCQSLMSPEQISLKRRVFIAGAWSLTGYALSFVIRLGSNLVMTRLLAPDAFGVLAIAQLISVGLALFSDVGLKPSVIQSKRGSDSAFLNTVWTTQIIRGALLWMVALLICTAMYFAPRWHLTPTDSVYGNRLLPFVVAAVSSAALVGGFESTKSLEASRNLRLAGITKIDLYSQLVGLFVMIGWGVLDRSIWALVAGGLCSTLARTLFSHVLLSGTPNRWHFEREAFREIIKFGKWIFFSSALFFFASNGDRLILGGLVDAKLLGTYVIAFTLLNSLDQVLTKIIVDVSFPALSEIIRDRPLDLTVAYYKFHTRIAIFTYLGCGALFVSGEAIVSSLYDTRYQQAGWILEVLALVLLTIPLRIATQSFLALGVERVYFFLHTIRIMALFCALPFGFYLDGFPGAIAGIVFSYFANVPMIILYARRYRMFITVKELLTLLAIIPGIAFGELLKLLLISLQR
jgi:O-antigen/teichoic acid export membrane protein